MIARPDTLRAAHFDAVLDDYCSCSSNDENLIDILTDAMHWCFLNGRSFVAALETARMHCHAETPARPAGRRSPMGEKLFQLANTALEFANEHTEVLDFDEYATVTEIETKLLAFGNLLETADRNAFLNEEIRMANETLKYLRHRKSIRPG